MYGNNCVFSGGQMSTAKAKLEVRSCSLRHKQITMIVSRGKTRNDGANINLEGKGSKTPL